MFWFSRCDRFHFVWKSRFRLAPFPNGESFLPLLLQSADCYLLTFNKSSTIFKTMLLHFSRIVSDKTVCLPVNLSCSKPSVTLSGERTLGCCPNVYLCCESSAFHHRWTLAAITTHTKVKIAAWPPILSWFSLNLISYRNETQFDASSFKFFSPLRLYSLIGAILSDFQIPKPLRACMG